MRLIKDAQGYYILDDSQSNVAPGLFGLPVVDPLAMTVDKFLIGNFSSRRHRWAARVGGSTEHADFFVKTWSRSSAKSGWVSR